MADVFTKRKRSEVMSKIRSKGTLIERIVFKFLRRKIYFASHYSKIPGKPDIVRVREKKAVFLDGDFWHGRDFKKRAGKLPPYWVSKIGTNIKRDRQTRNLLKRKGWKILRIWEHDLEVKTETTLAKIYDFLAVK